MRPWTSPSVRWRRRTPRPPITSGVSSWARTSPNTNPATAAPEQRTCPQRQRRVITSPKPFRAAMNTEAEGARFWFEAQPERLEWELGRFAEEELPATHHVLGQGTNDARLVIETELTYQDEAVPIRVAFPLDYPDAPPMFYGPEGLLERHPTAGGTNLCWSADPDRDWYPGRDAAYIVANNLRALLADSEKGASAVRAGEADMPEPLTGHIV